jgi:hypothetical protein
MLQANLLMESALLLKSLRTTVSGVVTIIYKHSLKMIGVILGRWCCLNVPKLMVRVLSIYV